MYHQRLAALPDWCPQCDTNMHVDHLPISLLSAHNGSDQHQGISGYEIPYASFIFVGVAGVRVQVEFKGGGKGEGGENEESAGGSANADHVGNHSRDQRDRYS